LTSTNSTTTQKHIPYRKKANTPKAKKQFPIPMKNIDYQYISKLIFAQISPENFTRFAYLAALILKPNLFKQHGVGKQQLQCRRSESA
jgi:hypothetical protein